jgi:glycosyltransferase involved in cell wall biosynthesis
MTWDERLIEYCALERYYGPTELAWFRTNFASAQELLGQVDVHIASTEYLAGLLREAFHKPTFANANAIARDTLTLSEPIAARTLSRPPSRDLMIAYFSGWARAHEIDLEVALPGLIRVLADLPDARLRIVGHFDLTWLPDSLRARVETAPFVPYERLFEAISDCDINLAPIANNPQRRSKSAIKYLEAALVGVPTVASDLEPYRVIRHGETGMLAGDDEGWYTSIMALASDAVRRAQIGRAARAQVLRDETTTARAPHFAALVRQIAGGR